MCGDGRTPNRIAMYQVTVPAPSESSGSAKTFIEQEFWAQENLPFIRRSERYALPHQKACEQPPANFAKSVINGGCGWLQIREDRVNRLHETSQGLIEAGPPVLLDDYDEFPPHWTADVELSSS